PTVARAAALRAVPTRRSSDLGTGLEPWFERISSTEAGSLPAPEVDYDLYAEGEALLGWLNTTVRLSNATPFDGNSLLLDLGRRIDRKSTRLNSSHGSISYAVF